VSTRDRPLPTPPRKRFGGAPEERDDAAPLTADRMAQAAAAGRLEEFLRQEIPAGDHARNLAMMMMGMSGMMPADLPPAAPEPPPGPDREPADAQGGPAPQPPPQVVRAVGQGDVAQLASLLKAEHAKRNPAVPGGGDAAAPGGLPDAAAPASGAAAAPGRAGIDAAFVDELIRIAADADVTVDWLMLRAVRLYVEEYRRSGRL
jgi:hypothetical protein